MCVDYRALTTRTVPEQYPLPSIQSILSTLGGSTVFSKIDLVSWFHQIDEDIEKTASNTQFGAFKWVVMPFCLCNAPFTFQRVVNDVLRDHLGLLYGCTFSFSRRMLTNTNDTSIRFLNYYSDTNYFPAFPCTFFQPPVPLCGYVIDKDGAHMDPEKIKVIRGWPAPTTVHEV